MVLTTKNWLFLACSSSSSAIKWMCARARECANVDECRVQMGCVRDIRPHFCFASSETANLDDHQNIQCKETHFSYEFHIVLFIIAICLRSAGVIRYYKLKKKRRKAHQYVVARQSWFMIHFIDFFKLHSTRSVLQPQASIRIQIDAAVAEENRPECSLTANKIFSQMEEAKIRNVRDYKRRLLFFMPPNLKHDWITQSKPRSNRYQFLIRINSIRLFQIYIFIYIKCR